MALEFTSIPDRNGPAIYVLGDGTSQLEQQLIAFGDEVDRFVSEDIQVVYLDPFRDDGLRVKEFYALENFPVVMIVLDDDTIYQIWSNEIPPVDQVAYYLHQITGGINTQ